MMNIANTTDIIHIVGLIVIAICAIRGLKKGFVNTVGSILASLLSIVFVYLLNTWALESVLLVLLTDRMLLIVRVLLCIVLYVVLFFVLKAIVLSLRLLTKLPVIRGLNKLLGFVCGIVHGLLLVGIGYWLYSWFV
ncbi:MAG: CvpA family protein [Lachnospiraceae bacterium]|nr:CvpA family protein [Lachnospiraceae bacterium]